MGMYKAKRPYSDANTADIDSMGMLVPPKEEGTCSALKAK
jgi:hypothetical protein